MTEKQFNRMCKTYNNSVKNFNYRIWSFINHLESHGEIPTEKARELRKMKHEISSILYEFQKELYPIAGRIYWNEVLD